MYELLVEKMSCGGCASRVKRAVQSVDGDATVDVDLKNKTVHVATGAELGTVVNAVVLAGYPVTTSVVLS